MANVETRRDENTFLGSWCNITNTSSMSGDSTGLQVYFVEIWARGGSRRGAKGIQTVGQKGWAKSPGRQIWRTGSSRGLSFQGRVGNVAASEPGATALCATAQTVSQGGGSMPPDPLPTVPIGRAECSRNLMCVGVTVP